MEDTEIRFADWAFEGPALGGKEHHEAWQELPSLLSHLAMVLEQEVRAPCSMLHARVASGRGRSSLSLGPTALRWVESGHHLRGRRTWGGERAQRPGPATTSTAAYSSCRQRAGAGSPTLPPLDLQTLNAHVPPSQSGRCKAAGTEEPQPSLLLPTQQTPPHAACVPGSDAESHARQHATPNQGGHQQFTRSLSEKC